MREREREKKKSSGAQGRDLDSIGFEVRSSGLKLEEFGVGFTD